MNRTLGMFFMYGLSLAAGGAGWQPWHIKKMLAEFQELFANSHGFTMQELVDYQFNHIIEDY